MTTWQTRKLRRGNATSDTYALLLGPEFMYNYRIWMTV